MRRIAIAVVVLLGVFAVDCCNATADAAWSDLSRAPHVAAVRVTTPVVAQHEDGPGASLPAPVPTVLLVLVLLFVLSADRRLRWSSALATGPPRRGPPSLPVLRSLHALESLEKRVGQRPERHPVAMAR